MRSNIADLRILVLAKVVDNVDSVFFQVREIIKEILYVICRIALELRV